MELSQQKFGVEIEFTGITYEVALDTLRDALNGEIRNSVVYDERRRIWQIDCDGSIQRENGGDQNELVTPILTYEDIPKLQEVVRKLKAAGAVVNKSCGMHVHVESRNHNVDSLKNLFKLFYKHEDMLYTALRVYNRREREYTKKLKNNLNDFVRNIDQFNSVSRLADAYSDNADDDARYSGMNIERVYDEGINDGTIEFRLFNATLHAGRMRRNIVLALAMSAYAINESVRNISNVNTNIENMKNFLNSIGITEEDEEMKHIFKHSISHLENMNEEIREAS